MVKFMINGKGKLVGQVTENEYKKLDMSKTALKMTPVTMRAKDGTTHECFTLTNKKGKSTPILRAMHIDMEHPVSTTTKRCLCEVVPTKKGELGYIYVNLQNGDMSTTFNTVGRGTEHRHDYVLDGDNIIQVVHDNLTLTDTGYIYAGRPTETDYKSYTRDAGYVVKDMESGKYGIISTFGNTDGDIKVFCPPVFDTAKIGHKTISTDKYNFLYEYYSKDTRVLADMCYGLALQKVKAGEDFRVGDDIQKYRANHPLVREAREKANRAFDTTARKGATPPKKMSIVERIKERDRELKIERAMTKAGKSITNARPSDTAKHVAETISEAYPTRAPYEYRNMRTRHDWGDMCDTYADMYDMDEMV